MASDYKGTIIACMDAAGGIGFEGGLPWSVPSELSHFRTRTLGQTVVVGTRTTLPPLPGRRVRVAISGTPLLTQVEDVADPLFIGGARIFLSALAICNTCEISVLPSVYECDTFFPFAEMRQGFYLAERILAADFELQTWKRLT